MYIIGMNGPPRSGKDTVAKALAKMISAGSGESAIVAPMISPLREIIYTLIGEPYSELHYEEYKDVAIKVLGGRSIRQAMIDMAEQHIRPSYGRDYWARRLDTTLIQTSDGFAATIVTDLGFDEERDYFIKQYGPGNVLTVHMSREGYGWRNDSRRYVGAPLGCIRPLVVHNNATPEWAAQQILAYAFSTLGWTI